MKGDTNAARHNRMVQRTDGQHLARLNAMRDRAEAKEPIFDESDYPATNLADLCLEGHPIVDGGSGPIDGATSAKHRKYSHHPK